MSEEFIFEIQSINSDSEEVKRRISFFRKLPDYIKNELIKDYGFDKGVYASKEPAEVLGRFLNDENFERIYLKYRFAGKRTTNLFYMRNISKFDIDSEKLIRYFREQERDLKVKPIDVIDVQGKTILVLSTLKEISSYDWETEEIIETPEYYFVVFRDNTDVVEIRGSDFYKANDIFDKLKSYFYHGGKEENAFRLDIDNPKFKENFEKFVKGIWNARIRLDTTEDTVGEISLKSKFDTESKKREDLRESPRYAKIMEEGGDILRAYVVFEKDGVEVRFQINFRASRISFLMFASEEIFDLVVGAIDDIAKESGKQRSLSTLDEFFVEQ